MNESSHNDRNRPTAAFLEFMAEDELITIIPNFKSKTFHFISGDYGPLDPSIPVDVPLWLAVYLKQNQRCQIQCPEWLEAENIAHLLEKERNEPGFVPLAYHYVEIGSLLLDAAPDDIKESQKVMTLLMDLQNVRQEKIRKGMGIVLQRTADGDVPNAIKMNNVSAMEIHMVRDFFTSSLTSFNKFATPDAAARFAALAKQNLSASQTAAAARYEEDNENNADAINRDDYDEHSENNGESSASARRARLAEIRRDQENNNNNDRNTTRDEDQSNAPRRKIRRFRS